jgi:hypothetical protein
VRSRLLGPFSVGLVAWSFPFMVAALFCCFFDSRIEELSFLGLRLCTHV